MRAAPAQRAAALLAFVLALLAPAFAAADPPVWRIKPKDGPQIVLFGSVHLLTPGLAWSNPRLETEIAAADSLWFETPLDDAGAAEARRTAVALSALPEGQALPALLPPKARARYARLDDRFALGHSLDHDRPWFAELVLTLRQLETMGAAQGFGVDETLMREAPAQIPRRYLETPESQVRMLAGAPLSDQVASLEETMEEIETDPQSFAELERAWVDGDTRWIVREAVLPLRRAAPAVYRRMVAERNRRWVDTIVDLLKRKERAFIVVGVGHLVGPDSLPALLRRRGLKVEGP